MLSPFVKWYVYRQARKQNRQVPLDLEKVLREKLECFSLYHIKIVFAWLWDCGGKNPNASATIPGLILVNEKWAALIALFPERTEIQEAFRQTIGHELTHQENDFSIFKPCSKEEKFVYWVNEVHADFGSIEKMFDGDVAKAMAALCYKKARKGNDDCDSYMHPSWEKRIFFLEKYKFDDQLIRYIAECVECKNNVLIEQVITHFAVKK